jgi:hypothetical protein
MDDRRHGFAMDRKVPFSGALRALAILSAMAGWLTLPPAAAAYDQYSLTKNAGNCADCHGNFRTGGYVSKNDNVAWGTSLHDGHRNTMLAGDCDVCHDDTKFPVSLSTSLGGTGFSPIGCAGCHGRAEPGAANAIRGTGLRQHHDRNGITVCRTCHSDSNPVTFTAAPETVVPPYYFTPDAVHPNKPTQACNGNNSESRVAPPLGLDNDGNNVYDSADGGCNPSGVGEEQTGAQALRLFMTGPAPRTLRVSFTLPTAEAARLVAFDIAGRVVAQREVGSFGAGRHTIDLADGRVPSGWYLLRLTQGGRTVTAKTIVMN